MKKVIVLLAAAALFASCAKSDKCKCTFQLGKLTLSDQVIPRPDEKKCSDLKVEDIKGDIVDIDLTKLGSVTCVNTQD